MCGEIEKWQTTAQVTVRVTSGAEQNIVFSNRYSNVEEIRLTEVQVTGFNGGVSGAFYLKLGLNGFTRSYVDNEAQSGVLIPVDVLNPHTVYSNPRTIAKADKVNFNQFRMSMVLANGATVAVTEACFVFTVVMRKSPEELAEYRKMMSEMDIPQRRDFVRNSYNPDGSLL